MLTLVTGGSASGKSEFAENLLRSRFKADGLYIATMIAPQDDEESQARVRRHREMRAGKGFVTLECPLRLADAEIPEGSAVLLEDLSNLAANELYCKGGAGENTQREILRGVKGLQGKAKHVVVVSNEIFSDGCVYDEFTWNYLTVLAELNFEIAKIADEVIEVVFTIPVYHKQTKQSHQPAVGGLS